LITEDGPLLLRAGLSALAERTMIAPDATPAYALSSSAYQAAVKGGILKQHAVGELDTIAIERWLYTPALLSLDGEQVDDLSLFLSLHDSPDERVQSALNEMLEAMTW
jgi:hypothetical protein